MAWDAQLGKMECCSANGPNTMIITYVHTSPEPPIYVIGDVKGYLTIQFTYPVTTISYISPVIAGIFPPIPFSSAPTTNFKSGDLARTNDPTNISFPVQVTADGIPYIATLSIPAYQ
jgi:hypothetical protein